MRVRVERWWGLILAIAIGVVVTLAAGLIITLKDHPTANKRCIDHGGVEQIEDPSGGGPLVLCDDGSVWRFYPDDD